MHIVDSCGWLEWFTDGKLAEEYGRLLQGVDELLVPAVVLYEVYKVLKREIGEDKAILAVSYMKYSPVMPLDDILALKAADLALKHNLAVADAMVYATALAYNAPLFTSDADFDGLPLVKRVG